MGALLGEPVTPVLLRLRVADELSFISPLERLHVVFREGAASSSNCVRKADHSREDNKDHNDWG